ncbi:ADP-ribosylglycohydrolase family protein [Streptomyces cavernicola]|uniref:ADP-ribosylglycohydrolase family protein n=1 Tax=Streptomyces cavernicola TaxID=3043613 RepID=A0ABT6S4D6_9ACTN|nr:ADP-ribosylglycohydrolase family protein [Streptomyces sp. B-S-A6]MDI3402959.1 ADP-ribosylglycohydrolase family protein [Streptomyces sp. B-S-A6]
MSPAPAVPPVGSPALRLTWVQPEDLLGHELRQAAEDRRDAGAVARVADRWRTAGGAPAPVRAGAATTPATPELRALATELIDELAELTPSEADEEPTELPAIKALCGASWPSPGPTAEAGLDRLHAAWLGRAVGCLLGKPVEKLPLTGIRALARATGNWPLTGYFTARGLSPVLSAAYPWNRRSAATSLAENIDGMPEDDDLNYPLLNLELLRRYGPDFTTRDVAALWLDELPAGRTFTAERVAYRNLLDGVEPPRTARRRNPFREWIGALIRADVHGLTHPGDPGAAAEQAHRDAVLTHTANGVYGAMFAAATIASAASGTADVHRALRAGLAVVPPGSRLARAVRHGIRLARTHTAFDTVVDTLHAAYGEHHWVHVVPNAALLAAALTHADGDFDGSVTRAVSGGWDTDSVGATAGAVAGLLAGSADAIDERWTAPLKNQLTTSVCDFNGIGFDELARLTALWAGVPQGGTGGHNANAPSALNDKPGPHPQGPACTTHPHP